MVPFFGSLLVRFIASRLAHLSASIIVEQRDAMDYLGLRADACQGK